MPDDLLKKRAQALLEVLKAPTTDDFTAAFKLLTDFVKKADTALNAKVDARLASLYDGKDGKQGPPGHDGKNGRDGVDGRDGRDGKDGSTGLQGEQGVIGIPGKDGSPDMAEDIRNKLELLSGDERLKASAISGLEDEIKRFAPKQSGGTNFVVSRGAVRIYDLSSYLDGVTKTFSLPAFWRILTIDLSSFPNALRPTTDYTSDGALMTITFTSEIDAASSLATGQTCIVTYAEG